MSKRGSGSSNRRNMPFGNISIGEGYYTSQEVIDIARKTFEDTSRSKNVPDWAVHEDIVSRIIAYGGNQAEAEKSILRGFDEKHWKKTRKGAKDFPKTKEEQRKKMFSHNGRKEWEVTSSTYERAVKRANKNFDKWFGRGMDKK